MPKLDMLKVKLINPIDAQEGDILVYLKDEFSLTIVGLITKVDGVVKTSPHGNKTVTIWYRDFLLGGSKYNLYNDNAWIMVIRNEVT